MKYWAYVKNEILGPFEKEKLAELPDFSPSLLICPQTPVGEKTEDWKEASSYPEIAAMLGGRGGAAAPAASSMPPASALGEPSGLSPAPSPAASPLGEPSPLAAARPDAAAAPEGIQLEPRADAAPKEGTGGLKHLNPTPMTPALAEHREPGGNFDIPVVKLSGELSGHGKIGHPGTIQSDELHKSDAAPAAGLSPQAAAAPEAAPQAPAPEAEAAAPEAVPQAPAPEAAAPAEARNFSPSFDPISLSSIGGRNKPPEASPAAQPAARAPEPAPAQEPPAYAASPAPAFDPAVIEEIIKRNLKLAVSPPPDIRSHLDPLVIKIDQMGEILSSMRNSQFQQEVLTKIRLIEDSVSELRRMVGDKQAPQQEKPAEKAKSPGLFGFGAAPAKKEAPPPEKTPEPEPAKSDEIVDEGTKGSSGAGAAVKKILRGIVTLALLAAVLAGAAFMLRNLGIFDVTPYLPFAVPGLTPAAAPAAAEGAPEEGAQPQAEEQGPPEVQQKPPELPDPAADVSPEIVFIARTYSAREGGDILESKIFADAIQKNGDINRIDWKISPPEGDNYKADAVIPLKDGGSLTYSFVVERGNKRVTPGNFQAKQVMQALFGQQPAAPKAAAKKPARKAARPARSAPAKPAHKAAPKPAPKAAPAAAPAEAEAGEDDEYEYVYVEEEEAGGGDEAEYLMPGFNGQ
ncbi:MAG: hypothetical protein RDU13_12535 [Elusimicrobiales bacterium]|nr:hypothetical protein [Elusimicrobiales bacterium]